MKIGRDTNNQPDYLFSGDELKLTSESILRFPLAKLSGFDPKSFIYDETYEGPDSVILALALIYNDFKTSLAYASIIGDLLPEENSTGLPNKHRGQFSGIQSWNLRIQIGIIEELGILLKSKEKFIEKPPFLTAISKLNAGEIQSWKLLRQLAGLDPEKDDWIKLVKSFLTISRGHCTFHYSQVKPLKRGYKSFFDDSPNRFNSQAFVSRGRNFEETRFYFADAAVSRQTELFLRDRGISQTLDEFALKFQEFINALHVVIRNLIENYLLTRRIPINPLEGQ